MNLMGQNIYILKLCIFIVIPLTTLLNVAEAKLEIPPCPSETKRYYGPDAGNPLWTGCKDKHGLFQGLLIQFSNQKEAIRIAGVKNSLRHGKEIRFGDSHLLEERHYQNGHLHQGSFIFKSDTVLARILPKTMNAQEWSRFYEPSSTSTLKIWLNQEPQSALQFQEGRIREIIFGKKKFNFEIKPDGRIFALNHPEIRGTPLIDPEALWALDADDLKRALLPGFGSCKQYAGPLGRFERNYNSLLYKREPSEARHLSKLAKMRERFMHFCFPSDLKEALGTLECPPGLPSSRPSRKCDFAFSDQIRIPYDPKYFKFNLTQKKSPEHFVAYLYQLGFLQFLSSDIKDNELLMGADGINIEIKKTARGVLYRIADKARKEDISKSAVKWWDWHVVPGH